MENRSHALIAGFFTLTLLGLAILLAFWLGRDKIVRNAYEIATKATISGLNLQAAVRYKGIKVGNVTDIDFDEKNPGQIILRLEVIPDTPVTTSTYATLAYQGVTGIAFIQLDDSEQALEALSADEGLARIPLRPGTLQNLEQRGMAILTQTEEVAQRLNQLLSADNQKTLMQGIASIDKAATAWQAIPKQLEPSLAHLPALSAQAHTTLVSVQNLAENASAMSKSYTQLSQNLQAPDGSLARFNATLAQLNHELSQETLPRLYTLSQEAQSSLRSIRRTSDNLRDKPNSLLFGAPAPAPGPGEAGYAGYVAPK